MSVILPIFISTAILLFSPPEFQQFIYADVLLSYFGFVVGTLCLVSGVLLFTNMIIWIINYIKQKGEYKRKNEILIKLEESYDRNQAIEGFNTKEECLAWSTRIAPLLKFNEQYHQAFVSSLDDLCIHFHDINTSATIFHRMINQVEMAIEDLKNELRIND